MPRLVAKELLDALAADLRARASAQPVLAEFAAKLQGVDCSAARSGRPAPFEHPAMRHLAPALAAADGPARVVGAARAAAGAAGWYQIYRGGGADPALAEGMLAAQVVGMAGIVAGDEARMGLFLLAPGIHYPAHTHGAHEIYYCLSGRLTLAHGLGGAPFALTPGQLSVTPPDRLHSLTTGAGPVLLLYVWTGEVDAPNWWWARGPEGDWRRTCWSRQPDGSWARTADEPVTAEIMAIANG